MKAANRDLIGGMAACVIGATYLLLASQVRSSALDDSLGPGGMPRAYGWAMLVLGMILLAGALWRNRTSASKISDCSQNDKSNTVCSSHSHSSSGQNQHAGGSTIGHQIARAAGLLSLGVIYILVIKTLGYFISIAFLIVAVALYMGERPGLRIVVVGLLGALGLWTMFVLLLGVAMPAGVLGFL